MINYIDYSPLCTFVGKALNPASRIRGIVRNRVFVRIYSLVELLVG